MNHNTNPLYIFEIFNKNRIEYLVIGGMAVSYYGDYRKSITKSGHVVDKPDIDLWYNPSYENYFRLLDALEELGGDVTRYRAEQAPDPRRSNFQFDFDDYTLWTCNSILDKFLSNLLKLPIVIVERGKIA